jgi:hypothetical protein
MEERRKESNQPRNKKRNKKPKKQNCEAFPLSLFFVFYLELCFLSFAVFKSSFDSILKLSFRFFLCYVALFRLRLACGLYVLGVFFLAYSISFI